MGENAAQGSGAERVIRTSQDLATALAEQFLTNADAGNHDVNDELITQLGEWKRTHRWNADDDLPRRFSGQLFPEPLEPLWFQDDPETLRRVRDGLINLPTDDER